MAAEIPKHTSSYEETTLAKTLIEHFSTKERILEYKRVGFSNHNGSSVYVKPC